MENNVTVNCKAYIDKVLNGKGPVIEDYVANYRKNNHWCDAVLYIDSARRDVDKERTVYLVLVVGDEREHHQECKVLGYADLITNEMYIFVKEAALAKAVIPGIRNPDFFDKYVDTDGIRYTEEIQRSIAHHYGIEPSSVIMISGPNEDEMSNIQAINNVISDLEGIPLGLYS